MKYSVEIVYPAPAFKELEELLQMLVSRHGGRNCGSGVSLNDGFAERAIEFGFQDQGQAKLFAAQCSFIAGIRVQESGQLEFAA